VINTWVITLGSIIQSVFGWCALDEDSWRFISSYKGWRIIAIQDSGVLDVTASKGMFSRSIRCEIDDIEIIEKSILSLIDKIDSENFKDFKRLEYVKMFINTENAPFGKNTRYFGLSEDLDNEFCILQDVWDKWIEK